MKRRDFEEYLRKNNCEVRREGGRHTVYVNSTNRRTSTLPRHKEIREELVSKICKDLDIPNPRRG
jgi:predicted RNA binding protein YcfA (HicA-like mRNA interferase family)